MISVNHVIIHHIDKVRADKGNSILTLRDESHEINQKLKQFVEEMDANINTNRKTSVCSNFSESNTVANILGEYFEESSSFSFNDEQFVQISKELVRALDIRLKAANLTTGGFVPVLDYIKNENGTDKYFLVIGIVTPEDGITINDEGKITSITSINKKAIRMALTINLSALFDHYQRFDEIDVNQLAHYAKWTQKGGEDEKLSNYFQEYLPVNMSLDNKIETQKVIRIFYGFADHIVKDDDEYGCNQKIKDSILSKLHERKTSSEPVRVTDDLVSIVEGLKEQYPNSFIDDVDFEKFCLDTNQTDFQGVFDPDSEIIRRMSYSKGNFHGIEVKGKNSDIQEHAKIYKRQSGEYEIVIKLENEHEAVSFAKSAGLGIEDNEHSDA